MRNRRCWRREVGTYNDLSRPLYEEPLENFVRNKDVIYLLQSILYSKRMLCLLCSDLT